MDVVLSRMSCRSKHCGNRALGAMPRSQFLRCHRWFVKCLCFVKSVQSTHRFSASVSWCSKLPQPQHQNDSVLSQKHHWDVFLYFHWGIQLTNVLLVIWIFLFTEEIVNCFHNAKREEWKVGKWFHVALGALDALAEDLSLITSTHTSTYNILLLQFLVIQHPPLGWRIRQPLSQIIKNNWVSSKMMNSYWLVMDMENSVTI